MNNKETLGSVIQSLRKQKNITQKELAKILHVSDKSISRWETDVNYPDLEILYAMSEYFGIPVKKLVELRVTNSNPGVIITNGRFKYQYIIYAILTLIILVLLFLLIRINCTTTKIYTIYGEDEFIYITGGFYINTDKQDILVLGDIIFKENIEYDDIVVQVQVSNTTFTFIRLDNIFLYLEDIDINNLSVIIIVDDDTEYKIDLKYSENIVENTEDDVVISFEVGEYSQEDIVAMLEDNGFVYINEDSLNGVIADYEVIYYLSLDVIQISFKIDKCQYKLMYDFCDNILSAKISYNSLSTIKDYNYYLDSDYLECNVGVCEYYDIENMLKVLNEVIFSKIK